MTEKLLAGAGMADITPAMGIQIAGDIGRYRPVEEIREPLFARALILESGGRKACVLSMDILWITRRWADAIRNQAAEQFGLDSDRNSLSGRQGRRPVETDLNERVHAGEMAQRSQECKRDAG